MENATLKRFYKTVSVTEADGGWRVLLDGRAIKTAAGAPQIVPTQALAQALAQEWSEQGETLDPTTFALRDLTDFAIDAITGKEDETVRSMLPYAETDTLCYRADPDEPLYSRQLEIWEPVLTDAERRYTVQFNRVSGILHKPQPLETLAQLGTILRSKDPFTLAALRMLASLAASLSVGLLALESDADIPSLWNAANLEEEWQAELWGREWEAEEQRAARFAAFSLAAQFAQLSHEG